MLVSASVCALFFTILVWCNSHTWIYFKHKGKYVKVEDQVRKTSIYETGVSDNVLGPVYATLNNRPWRTRWFHGRSCLSKVLLLVINLLLIILRIIMCQTGFSLDFPDIFCCRSRNIHTPPQTPPYHGTLNGHSQHGHIMPKNGTMSMGGSMGGGPMGPGPNGMTLDQKPLPGPPTLHAGVG